MPVPDGNVRNLDFHQTYRNDQTDQTYHTKSPSRKKILHFKEKETVKKCQKEVIYEYISTFAGCWSIFWTVVGSGRYILCGGGWWWVVLGGAGCWWVKVGGGEYICTDGGW